MWARQTDRERDGKRHKEEEERKRTSVTGLGTFWKFLAGNFRAKIAQLFGDFWTIFKNVTF